MARRAGKKIQIKIKKMLPERSIFALQKCSTSQNQTLDLVIDSD